MKRSIILLAPILFLLCACNGNNVYKKGLENAEELCKINGGIFILTTYDGRMSMNISARCMNGATFYNIPQSNQ